MVPVELWDIDDISAYEFNNKKHPEKHIQSLVASIKVQGHLDPIAIDKAGVIISGHGRFEALKRLGKKKVAVRCLRDISDDQASALRIAANKTVSNDYDTDALARELAHLNSVDMDLTSLGFDEKELSMLISDVGIMDDDSLVIDMDGAVTQHEADVDAKAAEADGTEVRLDKAFGFKTVPLRDQKVISRFMAEIEATSGKSGQEALISYMRDSLAA
jgi:hypothetical protein